jgi:hypothetical protein
MAEVIVKKSAIDEVEFFGKVDRDTKGNILSEAPSWYLRQQTEELERTIEDQQSFLDRGLVAESEKPLTQTRLKEMKRKLDNINESRPNMDGGVQDVIDKVSTSLGKKIKESMFSKSDMMKGIADAHEEAHRMADPVIQLDGDEHVIAKKIGAHISRDGKISRTDAERIWKFSRRALGEMSNTEMLRKQ